MFALPIVPGRPTYCHAVRNSPGDCCRHKKRFYSTSTIDLKIYFSTLKDKKSPVPTYGVLCSRYLSSRAVARQVLSAQVSLTSVFGMGTGGPSPQSIPTHYGWLLTTFYIYILLDEDHLGDPYRIRTDVNGVRGRCLNHLTNGPLVHLQGLEPGTH